MHESTYETMDWEAEAKRVARAFGIEGECGFVVVIASDITKELVRRFYTSSSANEIASTFDEPIFASINYRPLHMEFSLTSQSLRSIGIRISYTDDSFELRHLFQTMRLRLPLAKGLFHLGLLTPEIEVQMQTTITAHQKLEWKLEYEARYGL